jgi:Family of unknown function (DUF5670)
MTLNNALIGIAVVLPLLWLLGMFTSYTMGGFIYLLLVIAILAVLIRIFRDDDTWA